MRKSEHGLSILKFWTPIVFKCHILINILDGISIIQFSKETGKAIQIYI